MGETQQLLVHRQEGDLTLAAVDGNGFVEPPRPPLPASAERTTGTVARDADATAHSRDAVGAEAERLTRRNQGGEVTQ